MSKIKHPEFADWQFMTVTASGFWIYQNPENTQAAMVSGETGEILFIMDIKSGEAIFTSPNIKKYTRKAGFKHLGLDLNIRRF